MRPLCPIAGPGPRGAGRAGGAGMPNVAQIPRFARAISALVRPNRGAGWPERRAIAFRIRRRRAFRGANERAN